MRSCGDIRLCLPIHPSLSVTCRDVVHMYVHTFDIHMYIGNFKATNKTNTSYKVIMAL